MIGWLFGGGRHCRFGGVGCQYFDQFSRVWVGIDCQEGCGTEVLLDVVETVLKAARVDYVFHMGMDEI